MTLEPIVFSRSLYSPEAVHAAVEAFEELGTFEVQDRSNSIEVTIRDPDPDVADVLADELCNHALSNTMAERNRFSEAKK